MAVVYYQCTDKLAQQKPQLDVCRWWNEAKCFSHKTFFYGCQFPNNYSLSVCVCGSWLINVSVHVSSFMSLYFYLLCCSTYINVVYTINFINSPVFWLSFNEKHIEFTCIEIC